MDAPEIYVCGLVAYDGTDFYGFQTQVDVPTIQGALEQALFACTRTRCRVISAGRTDAGVHGRGQVIAVRVPWKHPVSNLERAWNAYLPSSISVYKVQLAPEQFHPRYSDAYRTYRYTIYQQTYNAQNIPAKHSPLTDRFSFYVTQPLDVEGMNCAAQYLLGTHDFATFGQPPQGTNTVRHLREAMWQLVEDDLPKLTVDTGRYLVFTITANAFLYRMVRNIVGTLLEVGFNQRSPQDIRNTLIAKDRSCSAPPVPACGLVLEQVRYLDYPNLFSGF